MLELGEQSVELVRVDYGSHLINQFFDSRQKLTSFVEF